MAGIGSIDMAQVREQLKRQRDERVANAAPTKVRMVMCGQEFMVLEDDVASFRKLGYSDAPADPLEDSKKGQYREGKYEWPKAKVEAQQKALARSAA